MEIMEAAEILGRAIRDGEIYRRFDAAKSAYEANEKLAEYLREYEADKKTLERAGELEEVDTHLVDTLQARLDELYRLVTEDQVYIAYSTAQQTVNALMEQVNDEITYAITGKRPCAHDCSCCGGGCSH